MNRKKSKGLSGVIRTCIGCRESREKSEMIRIVLSEGRLSVDETGCAEGRGVYLCREEECLGKALKNRGLQRGFRRNFDDEALTELRDEISRRLS